MRATELTLSVRAVSKARIARSIEGRLAGKTGPSQRLSNVRNSGLSIRAIPNFSFPITSKLSSFVTHAIRVTSIRCNLTFSQSTTRFWVPGNQ